MTTFSDSAFELEFKNFLEERPLYSKLKLSLPENYSSLQLKVIEIYCETCKSSRPFHNKRPKAYIPSTPRHGIVDSGPPPLQSAIYNLDYECAGCHEETFDCWIEVNKEEGWIRKVGQCPPWQTKVPNDLKKWLKSDTELYQKALACMSQSYGLGACAYMRRLIENQITPILKLLYEVQSQNNAAPEELNRIQEVIDGKTFDKKTTLAYELAPDSIIVDGQNPLKLIHDRLSVGVHYLSENESLKTAMELASILEYVIQELNSQKQRKDEFTKKIRAIK